MDTAAEQEALDKLKSPEEMAKLAEAKANAGKPPLPLAEAAGVSDTLMCIVPRSFTLTLNNHRRVSINQGVTPVPLMVDKTVLVDPDADNPIIHPYLVAHGVRPYNSENATTEHKIARENAELRQKQEALEAELEAFRAKARQEAEDKKLQAAADADAERRKIDDAAAEARAEADAKAAQDIAAAEDAAAAKRGVKRK